MVINYPNDIPNQIESCDGRFISYDKETLTTSRVCGAKTFVQFECKCGQTHTKPAEKIMKTGAYCEVCMKKIRVERIIQTKQQNTEYTLQVLKKLIDESHASLAESYDNAHLIGDTIINFICKCGKSVQKRFIQLVEDGVECKICSRKTAVKKTRISRAENLTEEKSFFSQPGFKFFDQDLNPGINPRQIARQSGVVLNLKCPDCMHVWKAPPHSLDNCKFCVNQALCESIDCLKCYLKTIAAYYFESHTDYKNYVQTIEQEGIIVANKLIEESKHLIYHCSNEKPMHCIFAGSSTESNYLCTKCNHVNTIKTVHVFNGTYKHCSYCSPSNAKTLCDKMDCAMCHEKSFASHPKASCWNQQKNDKPARFVFRGGAYKALFNCNTCNFEFPASCNNVNSGHWCPICRNKTELKLFNYLKALYPDIVTQYKPDWCKNSKTNRHLPFDFYIPSLNLIIELDGAQHFRQVRDWDCHTKTTKKDVYKMKCAIKEGKRVVRILQEDVWNADNAWLDEVLKPHLCMSSLPKCEYIFTEKDKTLYDEHKANMAKDDSIDISDSDESEDTDTDNVIQHV
jgi:hypothetical protein